MSVWQFVRDTATERREFTKNLEITPLSRIPAATDTSLEKNRWYRVDEAVAVYADLKGSTNLSAQRQARVMAKIYELFTGAWISTLRAMKSGFIDIKGDGGFGLFYGKAGVAQAVLAAVTFRTIVKCELKATVNNMLADIEGVENWELSAKVGIHKGPLLVKRVGERNTTKHTLNWLVWVGKPVNYAAKLSSLAGPDELLVTAPVYEVITGKDVLRTHLERSCGCGNKGLPIELWTTLSEEHEAVKLTSYTVYKLGSFWCDQHGDEYFSAVKEYIEKKVSIKLDIG